MGTARIYPLPSPSVHPITAPASENRAVETMGSTKATVMFD